MRGITIASELGVVLLFAGLGCDPGTPPSLSETTLTELFPAPGEEFFASAQGTDPDGDLDQGVVQVQVTSLRDEDLELTDELDVLEVPPGATTADLIIGLTLAGDVRDSYTISLVLVDNAGNESRPSMSQVRIRR